MSLPQGYWMCCPKCNSIEGPRRIGTVGVPEHKIGKRIRTTDSHHFKCDECGSSFWSEGATRREVMGFNVSGEDKTAV